MEHERTATPLSRLSDEDAPFGRPHRSGGGGDVSEACTNWAAQLSHERSWGGRPRSSVTGTLRSLLLKKYRPSWNSPQSSATQGCVIGLPRSSDSRWRSAT